MTWEDLKVFVAVARARTHAGAARSLRVDSTTVGRRIAALEQDLGTRLFDRTPEGLVLTEAGTTLLPRALRVEAEVLAAERECGGEYDRLSGSIRLTASDGIAGYVIVPRLVELRRDHPGLDVIVRAESRVVDLSRREADVAVRLVRPKEATSVARRLGTMRFGLFASRVYLDRAPRPRSLGELAGHAFIGFDVDLDDVPTHRWLKKAVPGARFVIRTNTTMSQVAACLAGHGIALLPRFVVPHEAGLVDVLPRLEGPSREMWAVTHRDLRRRPRVDVVFEWLERVMASTHGIEPPP